jgi:hypothetical protein
LKDGLVAAHPKSKKAKQQQLRRKASKKSSNPGEARSTSPQPAVTLRQQQRRSKQIRNRLNVVLAVVVLLVGGWFLFKPGPELVGVERPHDDGRGHVQAATYDGPTPTSGQHRSASPPCGVSQQVLPLDLAVHALEHGVVVFWYDESQPELAQELGEVVDNFRSHVIVSPSINLESDIVATAWNRRVDITNGSTEAQEFAETYRQRGPESVPCNNS